MAKKKSEVVEVGMVDASGEVAGTREETVVGLPQDGTESGGIGQYPGTVPVFVLRADEPGHLRALMAAAQELPDAGQALTTLREFELYLEAQK
jgi:hypothetical protein